MVTRIRKKKKKGTGVDHFRSSCLWVTSLDLIPYCPIISLELGKKFRILTLIWCWVLEIILMIICFFSSSALLFLLSTVGWPWIRSYQAKKNAGVNGSTWRCMELPLWIYLISFHKIIFLCASLSDHQPNSLINREINRTLNSRKPRKTPKGWFEDWW